MLASLCAYASALEIDGTSEASPAAPDLQLKLTKPIPLPLPLLEDATTPVATRATTTPAPSAAPAPSVVPVPAATPDSLPRPPLKDAATPGATRATTTPAPTAAPATFVVPAAAPDRLPRPLLEDVAPPVTAPAATPVSLTSGLTNRKRRLFSLVFPTSTLVIRARISSDDSFDMLDYMQQLIDKRKRRNIQKKSGKRE